MEIICDKCGAITELKETGKAVKRYVYNGSSLVDQDIPVVVEEGDITFSWNRAGIVVECTCGNRQFISLDTED